MATQREILTQRLNTFLNTKANYPDIPYNILYNFLLKPSSDKYQQNIGLLQDFVNISQKDDPVTAHIYRIVATIPDGTVWYDLSKGTTNTWNNFNSKTINENHNSRACFMDVLLNDLRSSFRLGDNHYYPLGILGYSFGGNLL
jgi:hypothetical protein